MGALRQGEPGPVVIVTGAAGRLGRAIASELHAHGARLLLVDRDAEALHGVLGTVSVPHVTRLAADVVAPDAPALVFRRALDAYGRVDGVVNNAGIEGPIDRVEDLALEDVRALFEVNVMALLAFCQEGVRHFRAQGAGRIVNMASGAGTAGSAYMAGYSASKHAVIGLTRSIALEVAADGVQVNAICPGCVDSPMMGRIEARIGEVAGTGSASFVSSIPAGRYCDPQEVARLVAWLAIEAPDYINGTSQVIDGALRA